MTKYTFKVVAPTGKGSLQEIDLHIEEHEIEGRYHLNVDINSFLECLKADAHNLQTAH